MSKWILVFGQSILFWLIVTSSMAMLWPETASINPFLVPTWWLWTLIVVTMFCLGTLVKPEELEPLAQHPWWVLLGVTTQLMVMPAAAWIACQCVPMSAAIAAGVAVVGCVPGAMASNVLTHTAGGSVAFSVSLTTIATLVSPATVPLALSIVGGIESQQSMSSTAIQLTLYVVVPTLVGFLVARSSQRVACLSARLAPTLASLALLWIIASVVAKSRGDLANAGGLLILALTAINGLGYAAGFLVSRIARMPASFQRALTLEVGMQNAGLGTALAVTIYGQQASIPTAVYTFGCMLTGTLLAVFWQQSDKNQATFTDEPKD